jgi:hypothetical protein
MNHPFTPLVFANVAPEPGDSARPQFSALTAGGASVGPAAGATASATAGDTTPRPITALGANGTIQRLGFPHVQLKRDGDRITHITIHCTCGQVLNLACSY